MKLIVGLGNPDRRYAGTRHNVGFEAAELTRQLLAEEDKSFNRELRRFHSVIAKGKAFGEDVIVCRPQTYMNNSGQAVREITDFYKLKPEDVIVIYDDIALDFASLRVRADGSAGGHNGMKSIIAQLGSQDYPRVRIGVGAKPEGWDLADYVLSKFTKEEIKEIGPVCKRAAEAALSILRYGAERTMNEFNRGK